MWSLDDLSLSHPQYLCREEILAIEDNEFDSGKTALDLMRQAGQQIAKSLDDIIEDENNILFLVGSGNNGGDAIEAASKLNSSCLKSIVYLAKPKTKEAKIVNKELNSNIPQLSLSDSKQEVINKIKEADIIVDAVFGTGITSQVRKPTKEILDLLSETNGRIISIDIPSGMDCNTGEWYCQEFQPDTILSLHFSKKCLKLYEDMENGPDIKILDIGIRPESYRYSSANYLKHYWPKRDPESHKGQNGRVMVIGGSDEFTGAPVLTGMATLRSGVDTLRIAVPETIRDIVAGYAEDFIVVKVAGARITSKAFKKYRDMAVNRHDVIVIGMGLSNHPECTKFVREFFEYAHEDIKFVIDAEAIRAFKDNTKILKDTKTILTPHKRELRMLLGEDLPDDMPGLMEFVQNIAKDLGIVILLKGRVDIITDGNRTILNRTGSPGMTVGGSGDVLAGVVGACQNFVSDPFIATTIAAYVMGYAGEMSAEKYGNGLMASDIIKELPKAFMKLGFNY